MSTRRIATVTKQFKIQTTCHVSGGCTRRSRNTTRNDHEHSSRITATGQLNTSNTQRRLHMQPNHMSRFVIHKTKRFPFRYTDPLKCAPDTNKVDSGTHMFLTTQGHKFTDKDISDTEETLKLVSQHTYMWSYVYDQCDDNRWIVKMHAANKPLKSYNITSFKVGKQKCILQLGGCTRMWVGLNVQQAHQLHNKTLTAVGKRH